MSYLYWCIVFPSVRSYVLRVCTCIRRVWGAYSCAFANVPIDMHMREYRRWMSNTWMDEKIDRHCMLSQYTVSRDYYSYLRKFWQSFDKFISTLSDLEISFLCISCCIFSRCIFDALNDRSLCSVRPWNRFFYEKGILSYDYIINIIIW